MAARFEKIHTELAYKYAGGPGSSLPGQGYSLRKAIGFAGCFVAAGNSERGFTAGADVFGVAASAFYARSFHPGD